MGAERFADAAKSAGVDGVLIVDYPPEEAEAIVRLLEARGWIPYSSCRRRRLIHASSGSRLWTRLSVLRFAEGVTGAANIDLDEISTRLAHIRKHTRLPVGVGFGIRDADTARRIAGVADAVIIGIRLVQEIETSRPDDINARVSAFMRGYAQQWTARRRSHHELAAEATSTQIKRDSGAIKKAVPEGCGANAILAKPCCTGRTSRKISMSVPSVTTTAASPPRAAGLSARPRRPLRDRAEVCRGHAQFKDSRRYTERLQKPAANVEEDALIVMQGISRPCRSLPRRSNSVFLGAPGFVVGTLRRGVQVCLEQNLPFVCSRRPAARMQEVSFRSCRWRRRVHLSLSFRQNACLSFDTHRSDDGRGLGELCDDRRRRSRRAGGAHRFSPVPASSSRPCVKRCLKFSSVRNSCSSTARST